MNSRAAALLARAGGTRAGVWSIQHVLTPAVRWLYLRGGGRGLPRNILLLTTTGRRTGELRTTPVFYLRDGDRLVLCNVNPGFERPNPWTLNLRAHPLVHVRLRGDTGRFRAREATESEAAEYWPRLVRIWPAYQTFFQRGGARSVFVLEGTEGPESEQT